MAIIPELAAVGKPMRLLKCQPIVNHPENYLDFSDYIKIITMKTNWNEVFKRCFHRQEFVREKLNEIAVLRNDIAHMRELAPLDRELFVVNTRQVLRAIQSAQHGSGIDDQRAVAA